MPQSGRIKKIKFRLNGRVDEEKNKRGIHDFANKVNNSHLFSIMFFKKDAFKRTGETIPDQITLGKIECNYEYDNVSLKRQLCLLPIDNDYKNYQLSEGDYINIRSERTFKDTISSFYGLELFYLSTFLLELDPL